MMLTTGNSFEGYQVTKYIDVIFEEMVIGIGLKTSVRAIGDMLSSLTGDEYTAITARLTEPQLPTARGQSNARI